MTIEFNISKDGKHFFATHERSCNDSKKAEKLKLVFEEKFPSSEGYEISISFNPQRSYGMDLSKDLGEEVDRILNSI
jgi:hypothetical protein